MFQKIISTEGRLFEPFERGHEWMAWGVSASMYPKARTLKTFNPILIFF